MDILKLLRDYHIPYELNGPHTTSKYVGVHCPFCIGKQNFHMGLGLYKWKSHCWRCGWHEPYETISALCGVSKKEAKYLIIKYGDQKLSQEIKKQPKIKIKRKSHKYPTGIEPLQKQHKLYLKSRNFDPHKLEKLWDLKGTGPVARLDNIDYSHRVLAPIIWRGKEVSWQSRDITGKHAIKYMACPKKRELIDHKDVLYGRQQDWKDTGICVEGITDVWRMGPLSFATFGISFTKKQVRVIVNHFKRVIILYDDEPQAQEKAKLLGKELAFRGLKTKNIKITGDPGDLSPKQAKNLIKRFY